LFSSENHPSTIPVPVTSTPSPSPSTIPVPILTESRSVNSVESIMLKRVSLWSTEEVIKWLNEYPLLCSSLVEYFSKARADGNTLLMCDDIDVLKDSGMKNKLHMIQMMNEIKKLKLLDETKTKIYNPNSTTTSTRSTASNNTNNTNNINNTNNNSSTNKELQLDINSRFSLDEKKTETMHKIDLIENNCLRFNQDVMTFMKSINKFAKLNHVLFVMSGFESNNKSNQDWLNRTISDVDRMIKDTKLNWTMVLDGHISAPQDFTGVMSKKGISAYCLSILNDTFYFGKKNPSSI